MLSKVGIFAQRGKNRPNQLGLTTVKIFIHSDKDSDRFLLYI